MYILPAIVFMYHTGEQVVYCVVIPCSVETEKGVMVLKVVLLNDNNTKRSDV